jgi:hypothetical protein
VTPIAACPLEVETLLYGSIVIVPQRGLHDLLQWRVHLLEPEAGGARVACALPALGTFTVSSGVHGVIGGLEGGAACLRDALLARFGVRGVPALVLGAGVPLHAAGAVSRAAEDLAAWLNQDDGARAAAAEVAARLLAAQRDERRRNTSAPAADRDGAPGAAMEAERIRREVGRLARQWHPRGGPTGLGCLLLKC